MSEIALPSSSLPARRWLWLISSVVALIAVGGVLFFTMGSASGPLGSSSRFYTVVPQDFDIILQYDGELQAVNNIDIVSQVEGQTIITSLVKEGTTVKKGDVLMTLDGSAIKQKIEDTVLDVQKAEADAKMALDMQEIQISQNAANLEAAEVGLQLSQIDMKGYEEGAWPQQLKNAQTDASVAHTGLDNAEEDLAQTRALFAKGFVTAADIKRSEQAVTTARNNLDRTVSALKVLNDYTHEHDEANFKNALSQAAQRLERTKRENASNLAQRVTDLYAKQGQLEVLNRRMQRNQQQLAACTITAPTEGLVVYGSSGDRYAQNPIQEGATVRERQLLLRLPDTSSMKSQVRVPEAQVFNLRVGQRAEVKITGVAKPIGATVTNISVLLDNSQRQWNPDQKFYPVDVGFDTTPPIGKPGVRADTQVFIDHVTSPTAVPLSTIYAVGSSNYVFASHGDEIKPLKIKLGRSNDTLVEVLDGLTLGETVLVLQVGEGQTFLEKAGIKPEPATKPTTSRS